MCDEAVDDSVATLKLISDCLVTSKIIKKLFGAFQADGNILCFNEYSGNAVFYCNEMGSLNMDLSNISLDNNIDEDES